MIDEVSKMTEDLDGKGRPMHFGCATVADYNTNVAYLRELGLSPLEGLFSNSRETYALMLQATCQHKRGGRATRHLEPAIAAVRRSGLCSSVAEERAAVMSLDGTTAVLIDAFIGDHKLPNMVEIWVQNGKKIVGG